MVSFRARDIDAAATLVAATLDGRDASSTPPCPDRVLGEGGMGIIYLDRDLRLVREVAIKVGIEHFAAAFARLAREALAPHSHSTVVVTDRCSSRLRESRRPRSENLNCSPLGSCVE